MARTKVLLPISALALIAQLVSLLSIVPYAAQAQPSGPTVSVAQLEQQLGAFPDYSKFAQVLQADDLLNTVLGPGESLYNKTIFAFVNAADTPRWAFNLTTAQCGLNDLNNGVLRNVLGYNIIKGKFTFAQLQAFTIGNNFFPVQNFAGYGGRFVDENLLQKIISPDLVDDPTLSVHGVRSIDYYSMASAPDGVDVACREQANPCETFQLFPAVCGLLDRNAVCQNPQFGVGVCVCSPGFTGQPCVPVGDQGVCGLGLAAPFPTRCYFNSDPQGQYVCCDQAGCDGFNPPDYKFPHCANNGYAPPYYGVPPISGTRPPSSTPPPSSNPPPSSSPPPSSNPPPISGDQGVCGTGAAAPFPTRCYFNSDPQGRYVCCDQAGCNGFNPPNYSFPHCAKDGFVPPGYGVSAGTPGPSPGPPPPVGDQGVCGTGAASPFPVRCWYNNDPQGRYVCCDNQGCDGFNPPDYFFPHCKNYGYVPPGV